MAAAASSDSSSSSSSSSSSDQTKNQTKNANAAPTSKSETSPAPHQTESLHNADSQSSKQTTSSESNASTASRLHSQYAKAQSRLAELIDDHSTLPTTISSVTVLNATNTRRSFLQRIFTPILSNSADQPYTLAGAVGQVAAKADILEKLDIYHSPISIYLDKPSATNPSTSPTDLDVFLSVREKSRVVFSSGTWAGTNDGSVYANLLLRNLFGGAESLNANVSYGTRTRSAYSLGFDTPILSNPDLRFEVGGLQSATDKSWASHEEQLRGGFTKLRFLAGHHRHELGYNGFWRQVTSLAEKASPTVRGDAGDSFKSSLSHTWTYDRRDNPLLPTRGFLFKTVSELAGVGPLKGDVAFGKLEAETQAALPIPIPGLTRPGLDSGISVTASLKGGVLCPLPLSASSGTSTIGGSRINDRFILGGPTDVRGFRHAGLGPRDGLTNDALGGDVYAAGGLSILFPMPRVSKERPLRLMAFINGGRLLSLQAPISSSSSLTSSSSEAAYQSSSRSHISSSQSQAHMSSSSMTASTTSTSTSSYSYSSESNGESSSTVNIRSSAGRANVTNSSSSDEGFGIHDDNNNNSSSNSSQAHQGSSTISSGTRTADPARLLAPSGSGSARDQTADALKAVGSTLAQLTDGLPSISAGVGVVYALPVARFEVNFSLPLVLRKGEEARKGVGIGVGISFL